MAVVPSITLAGYYPQPIVPDYYDIAAIPCHNDLHNKASHKPYYNKQKKYSRYHNYYTISKYHLYNTPSHLIAVPVQKDCNRACEGLAIARHRNNYQGFSEAPDTYREAESYAELVNEDFVMDMRTSDDVLDDSI
jgi:hypothetical protein